MTNGNGRQWIWREIRDAIANLGFPIVFVLILLFKFEPIARDMVVQLNAIVQGQATIIVQNREIILQQERILGWLSFRLPSPGSR